MCGRGGGKGRRGLSVLVGICSRGEGKGREGGWQKGVREEGGGGEYKRWWKVASGSQAEKRREGGAEERGESEASQGPKKRGKRSLLHPFATFLLLPYPDIFCVFSLLCRPIAARGKGGERASTFDLSGHLLKIHPSSLPPSSPQASEVQTLRSRGEGKEASSPGKNHISQKSLGAYEQETTFLFTFFPSPIVPPGHQRPFLRLLLLFQLSHENCFSLIPPPPSSLSPHHFSIAPLPPGITAHLFLFL